MITQTNECVVHNRKYLSKFHAIINQLRHTNEFDNSILKKLPKRFCSCHNEQNGELTFDRNHLHKICQEIKSLEKPLPIKIKPIKSINYMILDFPSNLNPIQRIYKAGRFVGRHGQHIKQIEKKFQISLQIVNRKSHKYLHKIINQLKQENKENSSNALWILIHMKNDQNNIDQIKEYLQNQWNKIDITRKNIVLSRPIISSSTDISGDTRWKPKKQSLKYQQKQKQKLFNQQEDIPVQPFIKPISMPKEIYKTQKTKRK